MSVWYTPFYMGCPIFLGEVSHFGVRPPPVKRYRGRGNLQNETGNLQNEKWGNNVTQNCNIVTKEKRYNVTAKRYNVTKRYLVENVTM